MDGRQLLAEASSEGVEERRFQEEEPQHQVQRLTFHQCEATKGRRQAGDEHYSGGCVSAPDQWQLGGMAFVKLSRDQVRNRNKDHERRMLLPGLQTKGSEHG